MKKGIIIVIIVVILAVIIGGIVLINSNNSSNNSNAMQSETFIFKINGQEVKMGQNLLDLNIPETSDVYEAESCAFDGIEKIYTYDNYEITTCPENGIEKILNVYISHGEESTPEGIRVGDTVEDMKQAYGEDFKTADVSYIYTRGNTTLTFVTNDDVISSIEYSLIID